MNNRNREVFDAGSLPALLIARARGSSDRRLALDAGIGVVLAIALAILRPLLWIPLVALAASLAMYGLWGILDREVRERVERGQPRNRALVGARVAVALIGALAGAAGALAFFFSALGTWIS